MAQDSQSNDKSSYASALFTTKPPQLNTGGTGGLSDFLVPASNGGVNVVDEYRWTLTDKKGRTETPRAILTEFRVLQSALASSARYYLTGVAQQGSNLLGGLVGQSQQTAAVPETQYEETMNGYSGLCDFSNPTGFWYSLPYFSEIANEVTSTWTSLDILEKIKSGVGKISSGAAEIGQLVTDAYMLVQEAKYPRVGIMDRPKLWQESSFRNINIRFPLFNTVDSKDIQRNWDLCYLLLYQNMFNKKDFITAIPPVFYTVYIPGQFFSIAMYVSDLKIYNRGNIRQLDVGGRTRNIPDVYEVDMTLTDIIMPSQNMLAVLLRDQPIQVFYRDEEGNVRSDINPGVNVDRFVGESVRAVETAIQNLGQ